MKPVLAVEVLPEQNATTLQDAVDYLEASVERLNSALGQPVVSLKLLTTGEELRQYEAGELVLYRKPTTRRRGDKIIYEKDGERVTLQQERLPL